MSTLPITQERREEARHAVRSYLAERPSIAAHPADIRRRLNAGHANDFAPEEVSYALGFLVGLRQVECVPDSLGATLYYRITSEGILAHERDN